ncbi:N-acetylglutaminylglutamine synthetase [Aestuariispira insulae]|uniref:GNAT-family acetyltransferase (TIGR03103 family) n=1 Tax=Aestuariispira insulae TaxID=1461337 RepID=A0A3D9HQM2_9PROT|nr:N-acetylglutaminylglutamine synthetase [Aestuariispira insulae]RED51611.1 GNAT-family acetyltransferase (TIGR03103 family) [Aestuariispira insulae]
MVMTQETPEKDPFDFEKMASLRHWGKIDEQNLPDSIGAECVVDCGWGRLIFGQTFATAEMLASALQAEETGKRDVALYIRDPHVVMSHAPQEMFLDPSHTYRLALAPDMREEPPHDMVRLRLLDPDADEDAVNRIYRTRNMVPVRPGYFAEKSIDPTFIFLVAESTENGEIVGVVTGIDHRAAFNDPDNGASLWSLAVDPQASQPGIGELLVSGLAARFAVQGRAFMDLSVMHDNVHAIALYEKLGFERVPVYCLKKKNPINEKLFIGPSPEEQLNIYARIIVDEARRRGIQVTLDDAEGGLFTLNLGGRSIACRESLSELTSAVAMSRCDDKAVTHRLLNAAGLRTPAQITVTDPENASHFLQEHRRVVVKPARGEQGRGIFVDIRDPVDLEDAITKAGQYCEKVLVEEMVEGEDLRIIVIDNRVVAGAVRRPARIQGDGVHNITDLIAKQSRRRAAATDGESTIPADEETQRCVETAGYQLQDVLPEGTELSVRKTANLHTGGTIHDVTDHLHPALVSAAVKAAQALDIPVVGLDLMVPSITGPGYHIIEANERPGLANHEPQPTAERFVDLLFPQSRAVS